MALFTLGTYQSGGRKGGQRVRSASGEFYYFGDDAWSVRSDATSSGTGVSSNGTGVSVSGVGGGDSGLSSDQEGLTPPPPARRLGGAPAAPTPSTGVEDCDWHSDVSVDSLTNDDAGTESTSLSSSGSVGIGHGHRRGVTTKNGVTPIVKRTTRTLPRSLLAEIRSKATAAAKSWEFSKGKSLENLHSSFGALHLRPRNKATATLALAPTTSTGAGVSGTGSSASSMMVARRGVRDTHPALRNSLQDLYCFHLREYGGGAAPSAAPITGEADLSFVGHKDILNYGDDYDKNRTIRSHKGTVRGVRNRVRAGITTYLQGKPFKNYAEREQGKVVVYTTSMGVVRMTYQRCLQVQRILGTLLINYEERDVSMNRQAQMELKERLGSNRVSVPHVFVEGQHLGDADTIEKLNESGDLRQILRRYKRVGPETICDNCGGYRYLPCSVCNGSKKSIHRNHFTTEFVALKCMNCDEAGLIRCTVCGD